jgi:hypothetical protein
MDRHFAASLRAHLLLGEELTPDPTFAHSLRDRLVTGGAQPVARKQSRARRALALVGLPAAALAALLVTFLIGSPNRAPGPAFHAPYPTRADLVYSYPSPAAFIHRLQATISLIHIAPGVPFAGHLRLTAHRLPRTPQSLPAYRLASAPHVEMLRERLHIRSPIRHVVKSGISWAVAVDGRSGTRQPLHSVAVSRPWGELIYHDRRNFILPRSARALDRSHAISAARRWLSDLGWPGNRMPVRSSGAVQALPKVRQVIFGWVGGGSAATEAATLWVTPNGSVVEAWVWPPVNRTTLIPVRSVESAWSELSKGSLPLAVAGISPLIRAGGSGVASRMRVVSVLTRGTNGKLYLVPTYRFEGRAQLKGVRGGHVWYSLVPSARK